MYYMYHTSYLGEEERGGRRAKPIFLQFYSKNTSYLIYFYHNYGSMSGGI